MTWADEEAILRNLGAPAIVIDTVRAEVAAIMPYTDGSVEADDLWAAAIEVVWKALDSGKGGGYIRIALRGALRDILRRERRAVGEPSPGGKLAGIRWPVFWPRYTRQSRYSYLRPTVLRRYCKDCGAYVESRSSKRCHACKQARRLVQQRLANATYWQRSAARRTEARP